MRTTMKEFHNWLTDLYDEEKGRKAKNKHKEDWTQEDMQVMEREVGWEEGDMSARIAYCAAFFHSLPLDPVHPSPPAPNLPSH